MKAFEKRRGFAAGLSIGVLSTVALLALAQFAGAQPFVLAQEAKQEVAATSAAPAAVTPGQMQQLADLEKKVGALESTVATAAVAPVVVPVQAAAAAAPAAVAAPVAVPAIAETGKFLMDSLVTGRAQPAPLGAVPLDQGPTAEAILATKMHTVFQTAVDACASAEGMQVRKTPSWPRSWANFSRS